MPRYLTVNVHEPAGTIILNRPDKRNALCRPMIDEILAALEELHLNPAVRAVIVTGAGDHFCAGLDLAEMLETTRDENPFPVWHEDASRFRDLIDGLLRFPKPVIAAVSGAAVGGGGGLALACDLVVGGRSAQFGFPEPRRGIVAGVVTPLVAYRLGTSSAAALLLSSRLVDADTALRLHAFHELVEDDLVWARANELAVECSRAAPEALQLTKNTLNDTMGEQLLTMLNVGAAASATSRTTEVAAEGIRAFVEKRDPVWPPSET